MNRGNDFMSTTWWNIIIHDQVFLFCFYFYFGRFHWTLNKGPYGPWTRTFLEIHFFLFSSALCLDLNVCSIWRWNQMAFDGMKRPNKSSFFLPGSRGIHTHIFIDICWRATSVCGYLGMLGRIIIMTIRTRLGFSEKQNKKNKKEEDASPLDVPKSIYKIGPVCCSMRAYNYVCVRALAASRVKMSCTNSIQHHWCIL